MGADEDTTVTFDLYGAQGGSQADTARSVPGGMGAHLHSGQAVTPEQVLMIVVGATDVRTGPGYTLADRMLVAGGGGGNGGNAYGGGGWAQGQAGGTSGARGCCGVNGGGGYYGGGGGGGAAGRCFVPGSGSASAGQPADTAVAAGPTTWAAVPFRTPGCSTGHGRATAWPSSPTARPDPRRVLPGGTDDALITP